MRLRAAEADHALRHSRMQMSQLANLWVETTPIAPPRTDPLAGAMRTDVLIVGAGYLGLSAALHLAEAGTDAVVLDTGPVGGGAAGRNGGQIIPGLKHDPDELEALFGKSLGERIWRFAGDTAKFVFDLAKRHALEAGVRHSAWVQGIHSTKAAERARRRAEQWQRRGADVAYVGADEAARITGTDIYVGAFVDRRAGALQPMSYVRGLAHAALRAGARLHEHSPVLALERKGHLWEASTAHGARVTSDAVILATNAYSSALLPALPRSIVAANSLQIATEPLSAPDRRAILSGGEVLSDTRKVIRYWRLDDSGRLLMGGRGPYREPGPEKDWGHLRREVEKLYPALRGIRFTHRWGGRVAIHPDSMPKLHLPEPGLIVPIGCQGRGIGWQTAMGSEVARLVREPSYDAVLPITPIRKIPFAPLKRIGVSATIAMMRLADRLTEPAR